MPVVRSPRLPLPLTVGICALFVMLGTLFVSTPASAHDALVSSDPAADTSVEALPDTVTLSFSAALLTMGSRDTVVDVLSPSGENVSTGDAVVDGAVVRQAVGPAPEAGDYTVNWHVVSSDGHPTEGSFSFQVESAAASEETAAPVPPADDADATAAPSKKPVTTPAPGSETPAAPAEGEDDGTGAGGVLPWILLGVTGVAVVGALGALLVSRTRGGAAGDGSGGPAER